MKVVCLGCRLNKFNQNQCDQNGRFWKFLVANYLSKVAFYRLLLLKLDKQTRSHLVVEVCIQRVICTPHFYGQDSNPRTACSGPAQMNAKRTF